MICDELEPLLSLYCDDMTSPLEAKQIEHHLAECDNCRLTYKWMKATHEVIANRAPVLPPPDLSSRIMRAIAAEEAKQPAIVRFRFNTRTAYALAASLLIAACAIPIAKLINANGHNNGKTVVATNPETRNTTSNPVETIKPDENAPKVKPHSGITHTTVIASNTGHTGKNAPAPVVDIPSEKTTVNEHRSNKPSYVHKGDILVATTVQPKEHKETVNIITSVIKHPVKPAPMSNHNIHIANRTPVEPVPVGPGTPKPEETLPAPHEEPTTTASNNTENDTPKPVEQPSVRLAMSLNDELRSKAARIGNYSGITHPVKYGGDEGAIRQSRYTQNGYALVSGDLKKPEQ